MESLRELYRIGRGPSSSHTLGPDRAARMFALRYPEADSFHVTLYGSLAKTGRGHLTDRAVIDALQPIPVELVFDSQTTGLPHPNTMDLVAYHKGVEAGFARILSLGGGKIQVVGEPPVSPADVYSMNTFADIKACCQKEGLRLWQYAVKEEGPDLLLFLHKVWQAMQKSVFDGLQAEGTLPGGLEVQRKAKLLFNQRHIDESPNTRTSRLVSAYAFAVAEQSAGGGVVVTAPTCGSSGVLPAVLMYIQNKNEFSDDEIVRGLAAAGLIGNLIKTNASISGAECGCQAEIGSATSMAAAALAELFGMDLDQIEYAAEMAMEHSLGLTCDPINGLVQIPCIERNAVAAMRAISAFTLANFLTHTRKISFDMVVKTMYETGRDLFYQYRETAEGGLAKYYRE